MAIPDPLLDFKGGGLRVAYATGRMLNTEDFQAEQLYHRGRLAHAMRWLHGPGTVNGLKVTLQTSSAGEKELQISPGMAVDRAGRLIEVFFPLCIRLQVWLDAQSPSDLSGAFKSPDNAIVADIFIGYEQDHQGKTPSFVSGDYDNTDAFTADRFLDSFSVRLYLRAKGTPPPPVDPRAEGTPPPPVDPRAEGTPPPPVDPRAEGTPPPPVDPRAEDTPPLPVDPWAAAFSGATIDIDAIKNALLEGQSGAAKPPKEYPLGADPTTVFLARVKIPATRNNPGERPTNVDLSKIAIDNLSRQFVFPTSLLAQWLSKK